MYKTAPKQRDMQGGLDLSGGLGGMRNTGVDDRNRRDEEQVQTDATREADSYAALQRKARHRSASACSPRLERAARRVGFWRVLVGLFRVRRTPLAALHGQGTSVG